MKSLLLIGSGSFLGGISRYLLSVFIHTKSATSFPIGTLGVNITGCFIIGLVFGLVQKHNLTDNWQLFLMTGILGGFTTFSSFSNETFLMLKNGLWANAILYVVLSILVGIILTIGGYWLTKIY